MDDTPQVPSNITDAGVLLQILDLLPTTIFVKNSKGEFEFSNKAHCDLVGRPPEKLLGLSDDHFFPAEEAAQYRERDQAVLETGTMIECEHMMTGKSGVSAPYLTRKSKIVTPDGKPI
jgi:PAS domain S-box-containing protein